jgi:DNA-binding transcriptional LysR family regulator
MLMEAELRVFLAVVDAGTFTAAADQVHLTQPAISASIRRLEEWAGARLLIRDRRGAELTVEGSALVPHARAAIAAIDDGRRSVRQIRGLERGEIRMGGGATACAYLLPPVLAAFRRAHPGILVKLREGNNDRLVADVAEGSLDLAVVTEFDDLTLDRVPFGDDELVLVSRPDVAPTEVVTFWEGSAVRALLLEVWPDAPIVMELGSVGAVKAHVLAGVGGALLARASVVAELASGELVERSRRRLPIRRRLVVVHRGHDRLSPATRALLSSLRDANSPGSARQAKGR